VDKKLTISIIVVAVFYLVGIIGISGDQPGFFVRNTPLTLVLSAFLLLLNHKTWMKGEVACLLLLVIAGYFSEVTGVNTGYLFGNYHYGKTLGWKLWDVPVVIGLNWMMLVYITGNLVHQWRMHFLLQATIAACLMLALDYFIEPVAIKLDYWQWENNSIPLFNYLCWFIISFIFLSLFLKTGFRKYNGMSGVLYVLQLLIFIILSR